MFSSCPPPAIVSTAAASSPSSRPSTPAAPSVPQPMDLDCTHPVKRDPHHGLCFNCGKPGHIVKVCRGPHAQNVVSGEKHTLLVSLSACLFTVMTRPGQKDTSNLMF